MDYKAVKIVEPGGPDPAGAARAVTHSILAITRMDGLVIFLSEALPRRATSVASLRALVPDMGALTKMLEDPNTPQAERIVVNIDHDLLAIKDVWPGADVRTPHSRRPRQGDPPGDIERAGLFVAGRAAVETTFRRINRHKLIAESFVGTVKEFNETNHVASGMVNLQVMMRGKKGSGKKGSGKKGSGKKGSGKSG